MGYLMKEVLKTLCGVNQWSYAVLWKIGYQNPRLLIWEECFCESPSFSNLPRIPGSQDPGITFPGFHTSWESCNFHSTSRAGDEVYLLIRKMMSDNHVNIVGEGLLGRVAFTGNHQWILSENYSGGAHPPEVLKELSKQFSAGMKTVAVIPVLPHGVVQFGSFSTITENLGFVNHVIALITQLCEVSDDYASNEYTPRTGVPVFLGNSITHDLSIESNRINSTFHVPDGFYHSRSSTQTCEIYNQTPSLFSREIRYNLQNTTGAFHAAMPTPRCVRAHSSNHEAGIDPANQLINGTVKTEVIPTSSMMWSALDLPSHGSTSSNHGAVRCMQQSDRNSRGRLSSPDGILMSATRTHSSLFSNSKEVSVTVPPVEGNEVSESITSMCWASDIVKDVYLPKMEASSTDSVGLLTSNSSHGCRSDGENHHVFKNLAQNEQACANVIEQYRSLAHDIPLSQHDEHLNMTSHIPIFVEDGKTHSGDDLFDILGADFKNKVFESCWRSSLNPKSSPNMHDLDSNTDRSERGLTSSEVLPTSQGNSTGGIFSTSTDHLLDAIVSNVHPTLKQNVDDNISCRTTLTNASSSSLPDVSVSNSRFSVSDQKKGELFGLSKYHAKAGATGSCSLRTENSKEDSGTCSQSSTMYRPELSSWVEKGPHNKVNTSMSTGCSKKPDETNKTNRKRLKPGENPRPRPKDRQMIQDRVKELREIVPNGAKCSIDALLERTIKHMLFLQSVTKHADKLKQTGNSKIISNGGGMALKDNFEGGATWAYEVGSNSKVCPIIVEDLNQPRQMLVEMLCEERGLFLEIADIIRGLGLCILKGVMETRNSKIWARFAVEADRDVTRMEIFMSLVCLLEQSSKGCVPQENNISCDKTTVQQFQHLPSPSPFRTTGVSHNFE